MVMTTDIMNVKSLIIASSKKAMSVVAPRSHAFGPSAAGKFIKKGKTLSERYASLKTGIFSKQSPVA